MSISVVIDHEFRGMIPPLREEEYKNLEESIRTEGCRDPIVLWNNIIVDGHNRYEICTRLNIPYRTIQKRFETREEAISWICLNQLCRRNLSEEAFRYLVGKRYDAEKQIAQQKNSSGLNQYSATHKNSKEMQASELPSNTTPTVERRTSTRIGQLYNLNHATVERYGRFSRSLDEIERRVPGMLPVILSGACKISKDNIDTLSQMPDQEINAISQQIHSKLANRKRVTLKESSKAIQKITEGTRKNKVTVLITGVKKMPEYDPDAKVNEVLLTLPAWISELERLADNEDFGNASRSAQQRLIKVLDGLESSISKLKSRIEVE